MKKLNLILVSLVSVSEAAQDADYELVTTGLHTIRSETALPVTVLTGDALRNAASATIGDTLANQPGINNSSFGPAVGQTVIRGQQGRRVLNLTNAIPNADAAGNSADHAITVEPILADAIEVLRGPATLLYGGGAIGGVVNVIDNRIPRTLVDRPVFNIESRHDSAADQTTLTGRLEFNTGQFAWHVDAMRRDWNTLDIPGLAIDPRYLEDDHVGDENTSGYIANTGGETDSATLGMSYIFDKGFLGLAVNRIDNTYGLPPGTHDHGHEEVHNEDHVGEEHGEDNIFIDMLRTRYDLTGEWRELSPFIEHLDYRLTYTDYQHAEMEGPGMVGTLFSNDSWQQRLQITHAETNNWHGVLGLQTSHETFGAMGEESFIPITDIDSRGIFLVEDYHAGDVTVEVGGRFNLDDYNPENGTAPDRDFTTFSYSASALWDINALASLGVTASHSERAPSVEELYSNFALPDIANCVIHFATGSCEIGNVDLYEEKSNNLDITLYLEGEKFNATLTAFYNNFDDYIGQVATGQEIDEFLVREYRQLDARFSGVEIDFTYMLNDAINIQLFGDTIDGKLSGNGDVPRMPPSRLGSRLNISGYQWTAFLSVLHASNQDNPGNFELSTNSYTRWDVGADYKIPMDNGSELLLFAKGRNLGDDEIRLAASFLRGFAPEAGRSLEVGVRFTY